MCPVTNSFNYLFVYFSRNSYVPRAPTLDGSPFIRPRKNRANTLPGGVKLRHAHIGASSGFEPERLDNNLITLEDFLAESEKTPNKVNIYMYLFSTYFTY